MTMNESELRKLTDAPKQFEYVVELGARPEEVFAFLADFPKLPQWMPMMKRVEVDDRHAVAPGEVGAVRVIHSGAGKPTRETVRAFVRPRLIAYGASDKSLMGMWTGHLGVLECEPATPGTRLTWTSYARPGKNPIMALIGKVVFRYVFRKSLGNLQQRFPVR